MNEIRSRPSRARLAVLAFLSSLVFVLYIDRVCIAQAATSIEGDLGISHTRMSIVFGAFTVAYGLFEVPAGRWGDRYGSRGVLTRIVIWWSIFTALTGSVPRFEWDTGVRLPWDASAGTATFLVINSFLALVVVRFLFGAGEAGALPNNARVLARWFPLGERGAAQGTILTCQQLGGACAPIIAGHLIEAVGWRWSFAVFGSLGLVWAALFYRWFRDNPAEHPAVNEAELELIRAGRPSDDQSEHHAPLPWRIVLARANVWLLGGIMNCAAAAAYMYMMWFPTYLKEGSGLSETDSGWLAGIVLAGGAIGAWCGGWLTARVERWTSDPRWGRRLLGAGCLASSGLFLAAMVACESPRSLAICATLACALSQMQVANWWSVVIAVSGRHLGALFGLMNSMGVVGAFVSPLFFGWFSDYRKAQGFTGRDQFDPAFYVYTGVLLVGAGCWLFVDPTRSAVEEVEDRSGSRDDSPAP